ncbi:unnamed protein product [Cylindrotheca closterium]|uniref:DUF6824 domain-containing protein n=1 Tax=Cylindrotheca closterium TaxID=2856 RepID=A0AAD2CIS6_9STRA|nr:unnamed protein product [Cylindrotheca closterium]
MEAGAGSDLCEPNSPEGSDLHEDEDDSIAIEVANTFDSTNDDDATVLTDNGPYRHRHPGELAQQYMNSSFYRPNLDWRLPPSRSYYPNWHHYPPRHYLPPPPPPPVREGDIFQSYHTATAVRPEHRHHHQQQSSNESEVPLSPPAYRPTFPEQPHNFGFPRQLKWPPEASPHGSNQHFPRDYAYHPISHLTPQQGNSDTSQGSQTPTSQQEDDNVSTTEFSGRRFIPTDIPPPPPPPLYLPPPPQPPIPPPPPAPTQAAPTRAPTQTSTPAPNALSVQKIKKLHKGSQGVYIWETFDCDILCGRGVRTSHQWGNKNFKQLVKDRQVEYLACHRNDKSRLSNEIMDVIKSYNGRFLRRVKVPDRQERYAWVELSAQRAYEKVCQALRDGGPEIREAMKAMGRNGRAIGGSVEKENVANGKHGYTL